MKLFYLKSGDVVNELKEAGVIETPPTGGHLHYVYTIKNEFSKTDDEVFFCSEGYKNDFLEIDGFFAKTLGSIKIKRIPNVITKIITMFRLFLLLIKYQPSNILCSKIYLMPAVFLYSKLFNVSMIVSVHTDMFTGKSAFSKIVDKLILNRVYAIICHGPFLVEQVNNIVYEKNKIYEYNAASEDLVELVTLKSKNQKIKKIMEYRLVFTYIGRIEESKGVFDLYKAFKFLINELDILLVFAGIGNATDKLNKLIDSDGLTDRVMWLGKLKRKEIAHLLNISSVVIAPSKSYFPEGRCMSAMEALVMGVPVIAPNYGPFPYLIKDDLNGLLFEVDNVNDLSNKLKAICEDNFLRKLKLGVKEKNKENYTSKNTYASTIKKIILSGKYCG